MCPRDIYPRMTKDMDRQITASPNDYKERDQRQYDLVQQYLSGLMLNTVLGIIKELGDPYAVRPRLGSMTAYPPGAMAAVCIMLEAQRTTYRKMVGILRNNGAMASKIGLDRIPSKSTIARAYGLIPEWYLAEAHRMPSGRWSRLPGSRQYRVLVPAVCQVV